MNEESGGPAEAADREAAEDESPGREEEDAAAENEPRSSDDGSDEVDSEAPETSQAAEPNRAVQALLSRSRGLIEGQSSAEETIKRTCASRWPNDFRMQGRCLKQQRAAYQELQREPPADMPIDIFLQLRQMCLSRWPDDFRMRLHCEDQQIAAWRDLRRASERNDESA